MKKKPQSQRDERSHGAGNEALKTEQDRVPWRGAGEVRDEGPHRVHNLAKEVEGGIEPGVGGSAERRAKPVESVENEVYVLSRQRSSRGR